MTIGECDRWAGGWANDCLVLSRICLNLLSYPAKLGAKGQVHAGWRTWGLLSCFRGRAHRMAPKSRYGKLANAGAGDRPALEVTTYQQCTAEGSGRPIGRFGYVPYGPPAVP